MNNLISGKNKISRPAIRICKFTLLELLVTLSVISVLALLLFPGIQKAREKARQTSCQSNLRQIGFAVHLYASDYNDRLPVCGRLTEDANFPGLPDLLEVYLDNDKVFHCPGDTGSSGLFAVYGTSYEWNTFYNGTRIGPDGVRIMGFTVTSPIVMDGDDFHSGEYNYLYLDGRVSASFDARFKSD